MQQVLDSFLNVVGALLILLISLPLLVAVATAVRLSGTPIFFKHYRIGKNGKAFPCLKFRTMHVNSHQILEHLLETNPQAKQEWDEYFKLKNDPRITRIGKFLRKSSLDELPQIFNVLRREMNLVGPRPILQEELDKYYSADAQAQYKKVLPGITGLWQVNGRSELSYADRVKLDMEYVQTKSIWLDILILFKTVKVVLTSRGSY